MIIHENGDLVTNKKYTVFCQQCSCTSPTNNKVTQEYPEVARKEQEWFARYGAENMLDHTGAVLTDDERICVNFYSIWRDFSFIAFVRCLKEFYNFIQCYSIHLPIGFPERLGCGLNDEDWEFSLDELKKFAGCVRQDVFIVGGCNMFHYNNKQAQRAQERYCDEHDLPMFAPSNGVCYYCYRDIYGENGITVEAAGKHMITGCPFCGRSYID